MRPNTEAKRRTRPSSPLRDRSPVSSKYSPRSRSSGLAPPVSILDREFVTENDITLLEEPNPNPRSFPYSVKQQCWEKAEKIKGRDPDRWRRDYLGNMVFRKLVGCSGCLCHDYDHIVPYSKGGQSTLENCQVLQVFSVRVFALSCLSSSLVNRVKKSNDLHRFEQQLIDQREIEPSCLELNLFRKALIVECQVVIWIFSSSQPMAMSVVDKIRGVVESNNQIKPMSCRFD